MLAALLSILSVACLFALACSANAAPDIIYLHGRLLTMDATTPVAQALATTADRIVAVGSDAQISALAGPHTRRVDLGGKFVMPGFNDAHTHQYQAGQNKLELDLSDTHALAEFQLRIKNYAATLPPGEWLLGSHWDQTLWPGQKFPSRQDIDAVSGDHPAFLNRLDEHGAVANTRALALAGVTAATVAPAGGKLGRDAEGQPDGLLFESAKGLVASRIPVARAAQRRRGLELAMQDALAHGVTSVSDNSPWDAYLTWEEMLNQGALKFRVNEWLAFNLPLDQLQAQRAHRDAHDPWLHTGQLKGFMDGSLGSRTAALLAPYSDDAANAGIPQYQQPELNAMAVERARAGFQLGFHAIGDRAARMALDAFAAAAAATAAGGAAPNPARAGLARPLSGGARNRIEHLQMIDPADIPRLKALGVIASVQPSHLLDDDRWAEARMGPERARTSYLWRSLLDQGVVLAFGTDFPVEPISPFAGIYSAVTRASVGGTKTYFPDEKISLDQALYAYTMGGAIAEFAEDKKGSLTPGKFADFIVLSDDLRQIPPVEILNTKVLLTVVGGQKMFSAAGW